MSITTYAELQTAITNWSKRTDIASLIPDFITFAENRLNRELRVNNMLTRAENTTVASEFVAVPSDFLAPRSIRLLASPYTFLAFFTPEQMAEYKETQPAGDLAAYGLVNGEFWFLPVQVTAADVELSYYAKIPALSDANITNWLLTSHPDAYLYGALIEAFTYLEDDNQVQKYAALQAAVISDIREANKRDVFAANPSPQPSVQPA